MVTREDIESFLDRLTTDSETTYEEVNDGMWVVRPSGQLDLEVVVSHAPPVALLRVKVMELPADDADCNKLSRRLLELNATDMVHGSYGIADQSIVLTEALELSHLDYEEFLAAFESMTLALASHIREFATYRAQHAE